MIFVVILLRCAVQGYSDVGGMERHYAMEYFAKLRMEVGGLSAAVLHASPLVHVMHGRMRQVSHAPGAAHAEARGLVAAPAALQRSCAYCAAAHNGGDSLCSSSPQPRCNPHTDLQGSIFHAAWAASDLGGDGRLDCREFCLFVQVGSSGGRQPPVAWLPAPVLLTCLLWVTLLRKRVMKNRPPTPCLASVQLLRGAQKGRPLPARLSPEEAAALLGERAMPEALPAPLHIDTAHMRAVLGGSHSRQGSVAEQEHSVMQVSLGVCGWVEGQVQVDDRCTDGMLGWHVLATEPQACIATPTTTNPFLPARRVPAHGCHPAPVCTPVIA